MLSGDIKPYNEKQKQLLAALDSQDVDIVGVFGPSGTGKSFVTCLYGIKAVNGGKFSRFVIVRPLVDLNTGRRYSSIELGGLFFDLASSYIFDLISDVIDKENLKKQLESSKLIVADPSFLAGRTFEKTLVFLDDSQYAPLEVIYEALLRIGNNSKLVIAGDPVSQAGSPDNSAAIAREVLMGQEKAFVIDFGVQDIVRPGAKRAFKLALEMKLRKREMNEEERKILSLIYSHSPDAQIITVVDLRLLKEKYDIKNAPDMLIVSKDGFLGRLIGRGGDRINRIEKDSGLSIRGIELNLDFKQLVCSLHPLGWIKKHVGNADLIGVNIEVEIDSENLGAFVGQKGIFVRFLSEVFKELLGVGLKVVNVTLNEKDKARKR
ncbi:MAG: PhoH family protein [Thermofilaceae archaeon]